MAYSSIEQEKDVQNLRVLDYRLIANLRQLKRAVEMENFNKLKTDTAIYSANTAGLGATMVGLTLAPFVLPAAAIVSVGSSLYQYYNNNIHLEKTAALEKRLMDLIKDRETLCNAIKGKLGKSFQDDFWKAAGFLSNSSNAIGIATSTSKQFIKSTGKLAKHRVIAAAGVRISSKVFTGLVGYGMLAYEGYSLRQAYKTTPELCAVIDNIIKQIEDFYNDSDEENNDYK